MNSQPTHMLIAFENVNVLLHSCIEFEASVSSIECPLSTAFHGLLRDINTHCNDNSDVFERQLQEKLHAIETVR